MTELKLPTDLNVKRGKPFKVVPISDYDKPLNGSGVRTLYDHFFIAQNGHIIQTPQRTFVCNQDRRVVEHLIKSFDENWSIVQIPLIAIYENEDTEILNKELTN